MIEVQDLDFKKLTRTRKLNGERTIALDVLPTENNKNHFDLVVEEATLSIFDDEYIIKKISEKSIGKTYWKQAEAIHKFYVDLINKQQPSIHNGSITFQNYMNMVFEDMPYDNFEVEDSFKARSFEDLGNENRLALLQKGLDRFKSEMAILPISYKPIFKMNVGEDTDFQFRYGHNIKAISREIDTTDLTTVIRGKGANGITAYYRSDNADIFGEIEADPVEDERFTTEEALLEEMISRLQDDPKVSVPIGFADLRAAGYPYAVPNEGDRVFLIYEPLDDLMVETRIMEINEEFDVNLNPIKTTVTLSNYTKTFAGTMIDNTQKQVSKLERNQNKKIQRAMESADGKNTNYYGANEPDVEARKGDLWFKVVDGVYTRTYRYDGDDWVIINDMADKEIEGLASDAKGRADDAYGRANTAQDSAEAIVTRLGGIDGDTYTQISQLDDAINSRVKKGETIAQINLDAETGVYIQGKNIMLDGDTHVKGNFKVDNANIVNLDAGKLTTGTIDSVDIVGVNITGANVTSYNNVNNNVVTLENGEITTFEDGKQRFGIYGNGLSAYHWVTEEEVATFRASQVNHEYFGAGIVGFGDYFSVGKDIGEGMSRSQIHLDWSLDTNYDYLTLHGGVGERGGQISLYANRVESPRLRLDSRVDGSTTWGNISLRVGLDDKKPTDSNFRSGFEVWQYDGTSNGNTTDTFRVAYDSSAIGYRTSIADSLTVGSGSATNPRFRISYDPSGDSSIATLNTSNTWMNRIRFNGRGGSGGIKFWEELTFNGADIYGHLKMNDWSIRDLGNLDVNGRTDFYGQTGFDGASFFYTTAYFDDSIRIRSDGSTKGLVFEYQNSISLSPSSGEIVVYGNRAGSSDSFRVRSHVNRDSYREDFYLNTDGYAYFPQVFDNTTTNSANLRIGTSAGMITRNTSSEKYKLFIKPVKNDPYKLLDIDPKDWYDKMNTEKYAELLAKKNDGKEVNFTEIEKIRRTAGLVANEVAEAGLEQFVDYDEDGEIVGLHYDRLWTLLIPIVRDHKNEIELLKSEINQIKGVS